MPAAPHNTDASTAAPVNRLVAGELGDLSRLLDEALALPPSKRADWLVALQPPDRRLSGRLAAMLAWLDGDRLSDWLNELPVLDAVPSQPAQPPGEVGPYMLLRELGRGGMATVWLARRAGTDNGRRFAIKFPHQGRATATLAQRLERERDILAALDHPGIVPLLDTVSDAAGQPCLVLAYVDGEHIDRFCSARHLGLSERLRLFIEAAEAVAYAHRRQVVHRDLKPSNILVSADSCVHLLDFGIARLLQDDAPDASTLTVIGGRPLTPDYASPEQLRGDWIGPASDQYSLGVVLYELLCGRRPHRPQADGLNAFVQSIVGAVPTLPSQSVDEPALASALEGPLDAIVMKALRKPVDERYQSVDEMLADLRRLLAGQTVVAADEMVGGAQLLRLADPVLRGLAQRGVIRRFARGEVVVREGEIGDALFVLLEGRCQATSTGPGGEPVPLGQLDAGDCFGELAMDGRPRDASVLALQDSTCAVIRHDSLAVVMRDHPELAACLIQTLIGKVRALSTQWRAS